jgi:pyridoxamine 5'-phosphate oxidase
MERDPIKRFDEVFSRARESSIKLPERMCLATASPDGTPSVRMMLLKDFDEHGFVFYTNFMSRKSDDLGENPRAELCFHWETTGDQVRVAGTVTQVSDEEADAYFATRDRDSQVGAWASKQSGKLESREVLIREFETMKEQLAGRDVARPPHWSGYRLRPEQIEFWTDQAYRLHDRDLYTRDGDGWKITRLYP